MIGSSKNELMVAAAAAAALSALALCRLLTIALEAPNDFDAFLAAFSTGLTFRSGEYSPDLRYTFFTTRTFDLIGSLLLDSVSSSYKYNMQVLCKVSICEKCTTKYIKTTTSKGAYGRVHHSTRGNRFSFRGGT